MRIGIIGAGQLGQMLGSAAHLLSDKCSFLDPSSNPPAAAVGTVFQAAFDDAAALRRLADDSDVVTYEFENVPVAALAEIAGCAPVYPPPAALENAQDRLLEKQLFDRLSIPRPRYRRIDSEKDIRDAATALGLPMVVKTRRLGYDGKGQYIVREAGQIQRAWEALGAVDLIAEQWIDFDYEISAIAARNVSGEVAFYPLTRNIHCNGILHTSTAPAAGPALAARAESYLTRMLEALEYVGVLALELFVAGDELLANEYAPRVHNSGHWTIEGARTSQFENHLRAITGRPLGPTDLYGYAAMLNLIGEIPDAVRHLQHGKLHDYGKASRPGRKLGHITVVAGTSTERDEMLANIMQSVTQCAHESDTAE